MSGRTSAHRTLTSPHPSTSCDVELRVGLASGETVQFNLPSQLPAWKLQEGDPRFQAGIRGLCLVRNGVQFALPVPTAFRALRWVVELAQGKDGTPASIRCAVAADEVLITLTAYLRTAMIKVDIRRTGRLRWSPT